ncbi:MAG TPA: protein kinase [Candidatus Acidoferrum sp.]|nr:protein kinase [Candidatus Acidoferrum sp.]
MGLATGTKLGPYEIQSPLGAGGMGEVYRASDTRLERTVAIKILPAQFSSDPVRKQRFEREAKTISSLNHPHICVLYDVGHQDGMDYLVMECVEGETLAKRLEKGPLPLDQVLKYGAQISDALDKAHRSGVVHRDLKPGNIMLTPTGAKLLDFGLAKPAAALASAATLTAVQAAPVTEEGTIVGTFQYMSPEQVEGKEVDGRSDIFSLGAVLYEMGTGKRAFEGKSQLSVVSSILEKEPEPISALKPLTPPAFDHTIRRCLAKDPEERWQTARDLALELKWIAEGGSQAREAGRVPAGRRRWEHASWLLAVTFFLLMMVGGAAWWQASYRRPHPMYFHTYVPFPANDLALSPDGRMLAMVAYSQQANNYALWTYEVGGQRANSLDGTQGASYPFWSPDGRSIGFFADGKLKKVDLPGGQVQVLCDAPNGRGGTWNRDGVIVFTPNPFGGLFRVSSWGGSPVEMTKPDTSRFETDHRWPVFLPDGKHFLYLAANFTGKVENNAIFLGSLDSQERRLLVSTSANAAYAEPGYLLYLRDNKTLVAQRFDRRRYVLSGEPHTLTDEVLYFPQVYRAVFSVSSGEVLVTQTGKGASLSQLTWFDRSGKPAGTVGMPGPYENVRLSPEGRRVATDQTDPDGREIDIWIHEPGRGARTRLTFDPGSDQTPIWSPDGRQILFNSSRKLGVQLYLKNADGSGSEEQMVDPGVTVPVNVWDWSRDGKYVLFRKGNELWSVSWPERVVKPLLQAKWTVRNAQFSPDDRWMSYASNETGSMEIYVSPFPSGNGKWQVSSAGGQEPRWRQDGKELFYLSSDGKMMAVAVKTGASFEAGSPVALFQTHRRQPISAQDVFSYDVSGDGQRFLIITKMDEANAAPLSVLLNWASEMEK